MTSPTPTRRTATSVAITRCALFVVGAQVVACTPTKAPSPVAGPDTAKVAAPQREAGSPIHGIVLDGAGGFPAARVQVVVGEQQTKTDSNGRFTLSGVPQTYDLVLVNEKYSRAHVYRKLTRRDPLLTFPKRRDPAQMLRHAQVSGTLIGGGEYPITEGLHVNFRGAFGEADELLGGTNAPNSTGPNFGPLQIDWDGPESFPGELVSRRRDAALHKEYCARTPLQVTDGSHENVRLQFEEVPVLERAPVQYSAPKSAFGSPQVHDAYHQPGLGMMLHGSHASREHSYPVADLAKCGLTSCTLGWIHNPYLHAYTIACGAVTTEAVSIALREPPQLSKPAPKASAVIGETFTWSTLPDAVYMLTLSLYSLTRKPSASAPTIVVYSAEPTAVWPDLDALNVAFPQPFSAYTATVTALGPYADLDQASGPQGLAWGTPAEAWDAESQPLPLFVQQPAESKCEYPKPRGIDCTEPGKPREGFNLMRINDKLRHYPEFANAVGLHCVQDCATARAYTQAYTTYLAAHPGFDEDEALLEPDGPPPPPPPIPF